MENTTEDTEDMENTEDMEGTDDTEDTEDTEDVEEEDMAVKDGEKELRLIILYFNAV